MNEEEIFEVALGIPNPTERSAYLHQACGSDPPLRQRVEALLWHFDRANQRKFLDVPVFEQLGAASPVLPDDIAGAQADSGATPEPVGLPEWPAEHVILNDYVVERLLGKGGMGKVYLLRSKSTGQRFAVKRALLRNEDSRRQFLAELRTWIDLPEHPHLVTCRFFRTVGDEVVIFAEYVEGGSLADWIRDRRLMRLEQILDVAIQFAWGLHAAHELGLVHQDVKPGNALMTPDGLVKVADFGLARGRAAAAGSEDAARQRPDVTGCAGTLAYQSPEQAAGARLTPATDVWSWGLAVLEMFSGERFWTIGVTAPEALKAYLKRPADADLPAMPNGVVEMLQKCFRRDSGERWASLAEVAETLRNAYRQAVGNDFPRGKPEGANPARKVMEHDRRTRRGVQWDDPRAWLTQAFEAEGRDPAGVDVFLSPPAESRKAQAIADLAAYEEAHRILERVVAGGRKDLEAQLATLCIQRAWVHENTGDVPGAVGLFSRAIAIYERMVQHEGWREGAVDLAIAYGNKAIAVRALGDNHDAVALYDRTIAIYERLVEAEGRRELTNYLARAYMNKAVAVGALGDNRAAVDLYDRAVAIYERMVEQEGRRELADSFALACMNKANGLGALGETRAAMDLFSRAIAIYGRLVEDDGRRDLAFQLALACRNMAIAARSLGDNRAAADLHDRAIAIYERLMEVEGRREFADYLAQACMDKALAVSALPGNHAAVDLYERAVGIYERLVQKEGRRELANDLARAYIRKANALSDLGHSPAAMSLYDRGIAIRERLVEGEGRWELADGLASACMNKAKAVSNIGDNRTAVSLYDRAIAIYERLLNEGREELQGDRAWAVIRRARAFLDLGDRQKAQAETGRSIAVLKVEIARTGRADLQEVLDWAMDALQEVL